MHVRIIVGTLCVASLLAAPGCKKHTADDAADEAPTPESSVTEQGENGTIAWNVTTDGRVTAAVKGTDGTAITKGISGTLTWPGYVGDQVRDITVDSKGFVVAAGPPLEDDLTEIDYALVIDEKPWTGVLHVPRGGTREIQDDAKVAANAPPPPAKGPNGGTISYVGGQPVELVADRDSGQIRVYTLSQNYTVMDPGERTFRLGYAADYPGMEALVREPGTTYYVGPWYAGYDPFRVTVAMGVGGVTSVGVVGWHYGEVFRVGMAAPAIGFVGSFHWAPSVAVRAGVGFGVGFGFGVGCGVGFGAAYAMRGGVGVGGRMGVGVGGRMDMRGGGRMDVRGGGRMDERVNVHDNVRVNEHENVHMNEHVNAHENVHMNEHVNVHENVHESVHSGGRPSGGGRSGGRRH